MASPITVEEFFKWVEKTWNECQEDDRGRVLNPNDKRYQAFKEEFDGVEFMNFFGFFCANPRSGRTPYWRFSRFGR